MFLEPNTMFDNRYKLLKSIGRGASAQVWLADDTIGNLRVAVKIFNPNFQLSSYGQQDFIKEFTSVYNITHQNLLTPTNYAISDGTPYLVMQYCENGSTSSMVGKCEQQDVLQLIHDVAAGLDYLHKHNIIHQDIKPDNIMVDEDLHFLVTDFGISTGRGAAQDSSGGTVAYMAPERFKGVSTEAGDIWSLGATAYEMLTGNPPYGDHGGILQASGNKLEPITNVKIDKGLTKLIELMLDKDPNKRPTAEAVEKITRNFMEKGTWKLGGFTKTTKYIVMGVVALLIVGGILLWGGLREKEYYYLNYIEVNGVPKGIGILKGSEQRHRAQSYRIRKKAGKVTELAIVNSHGKVISPMVTSEGGIRFPEMLYSYRSNGKLEHIICKNQYGETLYYIEYSEDGEHLRFYYEDGKTPKPFSIKTNRESLEQEDETFQSGVVMMDLTHNDNGQLVECRYLNANNKPIVGDNGVFGERYEYNEQGLITNAINLDRVGNPAPNSNGLVECRAEYDETGNIISTSYFALNDAPSRSSSNGVHQIKAEYDDNGNLATLKYYNSEGNPTMNSEGDFGEAYEYDDNGDVSLFANLGSDGEPSYGNRSYACIAVKCDKNGFVTERALLDIDKNPAPNTNSGVYKVVNENSETGLVEVQRYLDQDDNPIIMGSYAIVRYEYDEVGRQTSEKYFDTDDQPCRNEAFEHGVEYSYNDLGQIASYKYIGTDGNLTLCKDRFAQCDFIYNPDKNYLQKREFRDAEGKLTNTPEYAATLVYTCDDAGRVEKVEYFNADGTLRTTGSHSYTTLSYDENTSRLEEKKFYDKNGKEVSTEHYSYDPDNGQMTAFWSTIGGKLKPGTGKIHYIFNADNVVERCYVTDLNDNPINIKFNYNTVPDIFMPTELSFTGSSVKYEYDENSKITKISLFDASGRKAASSEGNIHTEENVYNERGLLEQTKYFQPDGKPVKPVEGTIVAGEIHRAFDDRGNAVEWTFFDGYGKAINNGYGYHKESATFDERNRIISSSFYDANGKYVLNSSMKAAKVEWTYGDNNLVIEEKYYDTNGKIRYIVKYKYNQYNQLYSQTVVDANGKPDDSIYSFSSYEISFDLDGVTYKTATYKNAQGQIVVTLYWDKDAGEWRSSGDSGGYGGGYGGGSWQDVITDSNRDCPVEIVTGVIVRSISTNGSSITFVIQFKNIETDFCNEEEARFYAEKIIELLHNAGVPRSIPCHYRILNKYNKVVYTH